MDQSDDHRHRSEYQQYPYLTPDEFTEACHHLDRKYCHATLGPLRRRWRLHARTALLSLWSDHATYVQITRPLDSATTAQDDDLVATMNGFSLAARDGDTDSGDDYAMAADERMVQMDEADEAVVVKRPLHKGTGNGYVSYEIHYHPTYRAPCLWFSLHDLPAHERAFDVETVFRRLVPDQYKDSLRRVGPMGGISADHHPLTGVPTFFIHPCLLGDAMGSFSCPKKDYLMAWLGLVGGCVGLWIPKEMALVED